MLGIYLGAYKAYHEYYNIIYQDIDGKRDIPGDMLKIDLKPYDYIIATPPCNYWSRANYRRETSEYAQKTKHLLPNIIDILLKINKPFIVENVRNTSLMKKHGLYRNDLYIYHIGRHTYFSNIYIDTNDIKQINDLNNGPLKNGKRPGHTTTWTPRSKRQGGENVHNVIERFLETIHNI